MEIEEAAQNTKRASIMLAAAKGLVKNRALRQIARALREHAPAIIRANIEDLERARREELASPLVKRLKFDQAKIDEALRGIEALVALEEPVGRTLSAMELDKGLELFKVSCPIGVVGVIFESRPDALVQIACLCVKSGNAVMLKGGSEAANTNRILADLILRAGTAGGLPDNWLHLLETREHVNRLLSLTSHIDLLIPRGSNEFVKYIMDNTSLPVLGHAEGICHVYVDEYADPKMALNIVTDSKCQYVAVCNSLETLLVHHAQAASFLPELQRVMEAHGVELRGCEKTRKIIKVNPAAEADWKTEYLDLILAVKIAEDMEEAIRHINDYGSHHTDAIVTQDKGRASLFLNLVDSADVFWNCSTRFSDGFRYGLGAEVGVSTNKIHARGPVGIEGLLIYKWKLLGTGQVVSAYTGQGARGFTHKKLDKKCDV
jgi:glutamate-5-semialdehyde dehydrogenase